MTVVMEQCRDIPNVNVVGSFHVCFTTHVCYHSEFICPHGLIYGCKILTPKTYSMRACKSEIKAKCICFYFTQNYPTVLLVPSKLKSSIFPSGNVICSCGQDGIISCLEEARCIIAATLLTLNRNIRQPFILFFCSTLLLIAGSYCVAELTSR